MKLDTAVLFVVTQHDASHYEKIICIFYKSKKKKEKKRKKLRQLL